MTEYLGELDLLESHGSKLSIIVYLFNLMAFSYLSLFPNTATPTMANYLTMFGLFVIPIILSRIWCLPKWILASFLVLTPAAVILAVIGPNEAGFYGYDPYVHTLNTYKNFLRGWGAFPYWLGELPALHALTSLLIELLESNIHVVGKYIPLLVSSTPLFIFLGLSRAIDEQSAFLIAMGSASSRKLLMFQSKYIEESLAVSLLFLSIFAMFLSVRVRREKIILFPTLFVLSVTHHYTAAVATIILLLWSVVPDIPLSKLSSRFETVRTDYSIQSSYGIFLVLIFGFIYVFPYLSFTKWMVHGLATGFPNPPDPFASKPPSFFTLTGIHPSYYLLKLSFIIYLILSLIIIWGVQAETKLRDWQLSWGAIAGIFAISYIGTLVLGKFTPLSAGRFLWVMFPFLLGSSISIISLEQVSIPSREISTIVLVVLLVGTQFAAFHPHHIDTNPSTMVYGESHYTSSEFATADWMKKYGKNQRVVDEQPRLWKSSYYTNATHRADSKSCVGYAVEREIHVGIDPWDRPPSQNVIYSGGNISLGKCSMNSVV
ncbi:hypothetical protein G3I44_15155 [Halogeometricum borinquense]|uniref:Uncharacterized protein n=1 Tax=Halogeometricum borinquense TaxID=60847 RepID=A0A6C0UJ22_9EURY|nr:hypothetical protein [Halogeometricum borinquense]QIB75516.1 hypothetical protein G3I44_15155 [Halogeometricum borinquense]